MKITTEFWDFIEKHVSNYHEREDVLRQSELQLFIGGDKSTIEELTVLEAEKELSGILLNLYYEAISAFTNKSENPWRCHNCGSATEIQIRTWVNPNDRYVYPDDCEFTGEDEDNWCDSCSEHTEFIQESQLIDELNEWWENLDYDDMLSAIGYPQSNYDAETGELKKYWSGLSIEEKITKWSNFNNE